VSSLPTSSVLKCAKTVVLSPPPIGLFIPRMLRMDASCGMCSPPVLPTTNLSFHYLSSHLLFCLRLRRVASIVTLIRKKTGALR
jgi:hypothetical protein